ncbi:hypothetical protein K0U07_02390 [bacterium]|nr:hypothetical protein [bacterium]
MAAASSSDKVKEISDILYKETILPAKEESERIIADAKAAAQKIIHDANEEATRLHKENATRMEEERKVHDSSIELAVKQSLATLKSEVMTLFSATLQEQLSSELNEQKMVEVVIKAVAEGIQKEGISSNLKLFVSEKIDYDALAKEVLQVVKGKLEKGEEKLSSGFALSLEDKKFTLKMTPETVMNIIADNLSDSLRDKVYT